MSHSKTILKIKRVEAENVLLIIHVNALVVRSAQYGGLKLATPISFVHSSCLPSQSKYAFQLSHESLSKAMGTKTVHS